MNKANQPFTIQSEGGPPLQNVARTQIRGSSLLLLGRGCSIVFNLLTQVATIRYLSKLDYGAFAYAISIVEFAALAAAFGMDKTFSRFGSIYHERRDIQRFAGAFLLATTVTLGIGACLAGGVVAFGSRIGGWLATSPESIQLLAILALLIPINAFSSVALSLFTILRGARTILLRKHVFGPAVKLSAILYVIGAGGTVGQVALAFLATGICGLVADVWLLTRTLRLEGIRLSDLSRRSNVVIPAREFFGYSMPLLSSDVTYLARGSLVVILLGWLGSAESAASFRAVLPVVRLNELVIVSFTLLFTPLASRLFAQQQTEQLVELYRRTAVWILMLSFPVFAGCVCFSQPLTVLLFGTEYANTGNLLVILASGYFVQAAVGFNSRMLKVLGLVWHNVIIDLFAAGCALGLCAFLIPLWQATGAALACSAGIVVHSLLKSIVLRYQTGMGSVPGKVLRLYAVTAVCASLLIVSQFLLPSSWLIGGAQIIAACLAVWMAGRELLDLNATFPELKRFSFIQRSASHNMTS
jgi:O-antigen/teichoic acid export membrane protein